MRFFHFWQVPLAAIVIWYGMLIAMLVCWAGQGHPIYWFMNPKDEIVYISDMGATNLKPLFIACGAAQGLLFFITLCLDTHLRRSNRLVGFFTRTSLVGSILAIVFTALGEIGIILCACFDLKHHKKLHHSFTFLFVCGLFVSSLFMLMEYFSLARNYGNRILARAEYVGNNRSIIGNSNKKKRYNYLYWSAFLRLVWTIMATILALCFGLFMYYDVDSPSAVFEWILAFWYGAWLAIYVYDFVPCSYIYHGYYGRGKYNNNFDTYALNHQRDLDVYSENKSLPI